MATIKKSSIFQKPGTKVAVTKTTIVAPPARKLLTSGILTKPANVSTNAVKTVRKEISKTSTSTIDMKPANKGTIKLDDKLKPLIKSAVVKPTAKPTVGKRTPDFTQKTNFPVQVNRPLVKEPPKSIKKPTTTVEVKPKSTVTAKPISSIERAPLIDSKVKTTGLSVRPSVITSKAVDSKPKLASKVIKSSVESMISTKSKNLKSASTAISVTKPKPSNDKGTSKPILKSTITNAIVKKPTTVSRSEMKLKPNAVQKPTSRTITGSRASNSAVVRPRLTKSAVSSKILAKASPVVEVRDADSTSSFNACSSTESSPRRNDPVLNFDENRAYEVAEQLYEVMKMQECVSEDVLKSVEVLEPKFQSLEMENKASRDSLHADENEINISESHTATTAAEDMNLSGVAKIMENTESHEGIHSNVSAVENEKTETMECEQTDEDVNAAEFEDEANISEDIDEASESFVFELPMEKQMCKNDDATGTQQDVESTEYDRVVEDNGIKIAEESSYYENTEEEQESELQSENETENNETNCEIEDVEDMQRDEEFSETPIDTQEFEDRNEDAESNQDMASEDETNENFDEDSDEIVNEEISKNNPLTEINFKMETDLGTDDRLETLTCGKILAGDLKEESSENFDKYEIKCSKENERTADDCAVSNQEPDQDSDPYFYHDSPKENTLIEQDRNNSGDTQVHCIENNDHTDDNLTQNQKEFKHENSAIERNRNDFYKSEVQQVEEQHESFNNDLAEENTIANREVDESQIQNVETDLNDLNSEKVDDEFCKVNGLYFGNVFPLTNIIITQPDDNFNEMQKCASKSEDEKTSSVNTKEDAGEFNTENLILNESSSNVTVNEEYEYFETEKTPFERHLEVVTEASFAEECESAQELKNDSVEIQENYFCENAPNENSEESENSDDQCNSDGFVVIKLNENETSVTTTSSSEEPKDQEAENDTSCVNDCLSYAVIVKTPPRTPLGNCSVDLDDQCNYRTELLDDMRLDEMPLSDNGVDSFSVSGVMEDLHPENNLVEDNVNECEDFVDINTPIPASQFEQCMEAPIEEQQNLAPNGEDEAPDYGDDDGYKMIRRRRTKRNRKNKGQRRSSATENYEMEPLAEIQENVFDDNSHYRRKNSRRMKCSPKKHFRGTADSFIDSSFFYTNPVWRSYYAED